MTKYKVSYTSKFKKQRKQMILRGADITELDAVIAMIADGVPLPEKYCDHALQGSRKGYRDCHIRPDWILIYKIEEDVLTLLLCETGSHSDLFR
ncbi:MAG: type II toxin-antitoxin system YafQ family toxin [Coriobacteriaceae bacterium]|jgi:mRNA interferase YafQ|nr:type II toxin-antitoxin system YafQ family toxin [Coriobacteriaceae bacterium]